MKRINLDPPKTSTEINDATVFYSSNAVVPPNIKSDIDTVDPHLLAMMRWF